MERQMKIAIKNNRDAVLIRTQGQL